MSLKYLLDTSVVSSPISRIPNAGVLRLLHEVGRACAIGAPVWHELIYGCERLPRGGRRRQALQQYLAEVVRVSFPILPYDERAAAWHGRERARLDAQGKTAPWVDGQIASIAATNGLVLVTRNRRDFANFLDLTVEDWEGSASEV